MLRTGDITYVGVIAYINTEGKTRPLYIVYEDRDTGAREKYKIDKIVDYSEDVPGHFVWRVIVRNRMVNLLSSDGKWYTVR